MFQRKTGTKHFPIQTRQLLTLTAKRARDIRFHVSVAACGIFCTKVFLFPSTRTPFLPDRPTLFAADKGKPRKTGDGCSAAGSCLNETVVTQNIYGTEATRYPSRLPGLCSIILVLYALYLLSPNLMDDQLLVESTQHKYDIGMNQMKPIPGTVPRARWPQCFRARTGRVDGPVGHGAYYVRRGSETPGVCQGGTAVRRPYMWHSAPIPCQLFCVSATTYRHLRPLVDRWRLTRQQPRQPALSVWRPLSCDVVRRPVPPESPLRRWPRFAPLAWSAAPTASASRRRHDPLGAGCTANVKQLKIITFLMRIIDKLLVSMNPYLFHITHCSEVHNDSFEKQLHPFP